MNWYKLSFTESEIDANYDQKFIKDTIHLFHTHQHPEGLALYEGKLGVNDEISLVLSIPKQLEPKIQPELSIFPTTPIEKPDPVYLELVAGKANIL